MTVPRNTRSSSITPAEWMWRTEGNKVEYATLALSLVHTVKGLVGECDIGVISWGDIKAVCYRKAGLGNHTSGD